MLIRNLKAMILVALLAIATTAEYADAAVFSIQIGQNLYVLGDGSSNELSVNVDSVFGEVVVSGDVYFVDEIRKIFVWTYGGDDNVSISQSTFFPPMGLLEFGEQSALPRIDIDVITSAGDDNVRISGDWGRTRVFTGLGRDEVYLGDEKVVPKFPPSDDIYTVSIGEYYGGYSTCFRDLYVSTGADDDFVRMDNVSVGFRSEDDLGFAWSQTYTGGGDDTVSINNYSTKPGLFDFVRTYCLTGAGDDNVYFEGDLRPLDYFNGGGGFSDRLCVDAAADDVLILGFEEECEDEYEEIDLE